MAYLGRGYASCEMVSIDSRQHNNDVLRNLKHGRGPGIVIDQFSVGRTFLLQAIVVSCSQWCIVKDEWVYLHHSA